MRDGAVGQNLPIQLAEFGAAFRLAACEWWPWRLPDVDPSTQNMLSTGNRPAGSVPDRSGRSRILLYRQEKGRSGSCARRI